MPTFHSPLAPRKARGDRKLPLSRLADLPASVAGDARLTINATWLMKLRWVAVAGQLTTILVAELWLGVSFPNLPLIAGLAITSATNLCFTVWLRRRLAEAGATKDLPSRSTWYRIFAGLMLLDLVVLSLLLYFTGGPANPFSLFYFVNLALSGILLPASWAWLLSALSIASFTFLLWHHVPILPLRLPERLLTWRELGYVSLAQQGILVAFSACSIVIVYFTTRLTSELQLREEQLRLAEMRQARSDKWEALGTLAAGAAHELATPLSTIAVVANEMERELAEQDIPDQLRDDFGVLQRELTRCRSILDRMSVEAGHVAGEAIVVATTETLVRCVLGGLSCDPGRIMVKYSAEAREVPLQVPLHALAQALRGILQNGLDASEPEQAIRLDVSVEPLFVCLEVCDFGMGMSVETLERADEPFFTTKDPGRGMGLGRFLARSVVERLGGTMRTTSEVNAGTQVYIRLPIFRDRPTNART